MAHVHAHIHHRALRLFAQRGHGSDHAQARGEGAAGVAATVHAFGHDGIGLVGLRLDHHIEGFGDADLEFVGLDRFDFLAVGRHHGHRQARHADVEIGHGRGIDHPQADTLARREQPRPVGLGVQAVHQIGVGMAGDVGDIAGTHAHIAPGQTVPERVGHTGGTKILGQIAQGALAEVVVVAHLLEPGDDPLRILEGPVVEHDDVLAVGIDAVILGRMNHDRADLAALFLQSGMAVIPVGARLPDREIDFEALARGDPRKSHAGNAVHLKRQQQAVPVHRGRFIEMVVYPQAGITAFPEFQDRAGRTVVDGERRSPAAGDIDALAAYVQIHDDIPGRPACDPGRRGARLLSCIRAAAISGIGR